MTDKERHDLLMSTKIKDIISPEFDNWLLENKFFIAPASTKFHANYPGGLFDHSFAVMNFLVELSSKNAIKWRRTESPFIIGMFHDLYKIDQYRHPVTGSIYDGDKECLICDEIAWEDNPDIAVKGRGDKSIIFLSQYMTLTEEEIMCILYHMGAFTEKDLWGDYTRAVGKFPNILWTHHADMLVSHVVGL